MNDLLGVTVAVATSLEASGITYSVGGSLASSYCGEPRASIDADIVVAMAKQHVSPFLRALGSARLHAGGE